MSRVSWPILLASLSFVACEKCAPGKVGTGVARLTIRNVGAIVEAVSTNTDCGFESETVLKNPIIEGKAGSEGLVTYRIEECYLNYTVEAPFISEDCDGNITAATGELLVTAEKRVGGMITGDPAQPVIPGGPDAATIVIERAQFEEFRVEKSNSTKTLTMNQGSISAEMSPRLAVARSTGVCSVPTRHIGFDNVIYEPSVVRVTTEDRDFSVDVDRSAMGAAHGPYHDRENDLWGEIVVWGSQQQVPAGNDSDGLDPDYEPESFKSSMACTPDLFHPIDFTCADTVGPRLAAAASRLTVRSFGRIAKMIEANSTCGFSSPAVAGAATVMGDVGGLGSVTFTVSDCVIDLPAPTTIGASCTGVESVASGRLSVSGTKTVTGRLTGDPASPVVPMSDSPAEILLDVTPQGFAIDEDGKRFEILDGRISGKLVPRVAADVTQSGACAFTSAIARFFALRYEEPAEVIIATESGSFRTTIEDSDLEALNGTWGDHSNLLDGNITLAGERYLLPVTPEDDGLDPEFEQATFDASWQCGDSLEMPPRFDCDFTAPLAQGAGQLTILAIGKIAGLLEANTECGFTSPSVGLNPTITGDLGYPGATGVWSVDSPCEMRLGTRTEIERDCNGKGYYAEGTVRVTGTKTIEGISSGDPLQPIVPTTRDPATLRISATFDNFMIWSDPEENKLLIRRGTLSGTVRPRVAQDLTTGACSISTPVAAFEDVTWQDADVTVFKGPKQFNLTLGSSDLNAQNGNGDARVNSLGGALEVDGTSFALPLGGDDTLDPEYEQGIFDASYACLPSMRVPAKEEDCNMKSVIGHGVARLLVLTAGTIASQVNGNDDCGFENFWVKTDPSNVVGDSGDMGLLEWEIEDCQLNGPGNQPYDTDCLLRDKFLSGDFTVDAHRTVRGLRKTELLIFDSIDPVAHDSVDIDLVNVQLNDFHHWEIDPGSFGVLRSIHIESGSLSAVVHPITGERASSPGIYDVPTPVAHMTDVSLTGGPVTVESEGKTFKVYVNEAQIEAFNGSYNGMGMTNILQGRITMDGTEILVGGGLDPTFEQQNFDDRYVCESDLAYPIPAMP